MNKILNIFNFSGRGNKSDFNEFDFYANDYDMNIFNTFEADVASEFGKKTVQPVLGKNKLDGTEADEYGMSEFSKMMGDLDAIADKYAFPPVRYNAA